MLNYKPLKNCAGICLNGDYTSLRALHEVVHRVNENSVIIRDKEGMFLGLAYDLRKAYERQRQIIKPPAKSKVIGVRYGVNILWPTLLVQARMLRVGLGFMTSNALDQAMTFALEYVIESAVKECFTAKEAESVLTAWRRVDPTHPNPEAVFHSRGHLFCSWSKSDRAHQLPLLLGTLDPMYDFEVKLAIKHGRVEGLIDPDVFRGRERADWPDPRW